MALHSSLSWLLYGLVLIFSIKLLNVSALNCDAKGQCSCATGSTTIIDKFICDGEDDCVDGSDELNCAKRVCLPTEHRCKNDRCIRKEWTCDNYADCQDGSDEKASLCNFTSCAPNQFRCYNGYCLPGTLKCDGDIDCLGGEDEQDCSTKPVNCTDDLFQCKNLKCVTKSFLCNGEDECGDNSDESDCGATCSAGSFTCKSGKCIPGNLKCNGKHDCLDGSDEEPCPTAKPISCSADELLCDVDQCKPNYVKCDGEKDCNDGSDEMSCDAVKCSSRLEDLCDDKKSCIMKYKFCNGKVDCEDGSDEKASRCSPSSTATVAPSTPFTCGTDEYKCKDALKCISNKTVCDQIQDCPNGDDESFCLENECKKDNCSHICHDSETGYYCSCKHGFRMLSDSKTCQDVNECETVGKCSQKCTNTEGSYKCSCTSGYISSPNGRSCFPKSGKKEELLVAVGVDVRSVSHDGSRVERLVGNNTKNAIAVGVHYKKNTMFWVDEYMGKIFSSILGGDDPAKIVVTANFIKDLAIDWITEKLYWLTRSKHVSKIHVAEFDGTNHKIVYSAQKDIHSIVVNPLEGYVYWTSPLDQKISRACMNGEKKEDIITTSLLFPTGLTIDFPNKKLFWLDSKMHHIESSDFNGSNRRHIRVYKSRQPFDIAVFGDNLYWSDSLLKTVSSVNKFTGQNKTVLIDRENITSFVPKGISIQHSLSQPEVANRCQNNGGCSHLCLLVPNGFRCACPENGVLLPDNKTCKMPVKSTTTTPSTTTLSTTTPSTTTPSTTTKNKTQKTQQGTSPTKDSDTPTTKPGNPASRSQGSSMNPQILGGISAGVVFLVLILVIVIVWCRRKNNTNKMEIYYTSEVGNVKILSAPVGGNPTQSKKDVDRESYVKFANKNFKENFDDDEDEDVDNIGEKQPVFKTFKQQEDEQGLVGQIV